MWCAAWTHASGESRPVDAYTRYLRTDKPVNQRALGERGTRQATSVASLPGVLRKAMHYYHPTVM